MPPAFWLVLAFFLGSFVGSFLNVVVYRLPRNCLSINNPKRSFCPSCKTQLKWSDNLPIVGWAVLRGKCRYCGVRFGVRYPLVELLTATLFTLATWRVLISDGNVASQPLAWLTLLHTVLVISVLLPWALIDLDLR
ncbi:MAG: prepilin peptidase, partial [Planctomycetes bacterium]|nr:prepilin peptidase [Planctomycetota bacterium]